MKRISQGVVATTLFVLFLSQAASAEMHLIGAASTTAASNTVGHLDLNATRCNAAPEYAPASNDVSIFAPLSAPDILSLSPQCMPAVATRFVKNHLLTLVRSISLASSHTQAKIGLVIHF